MSEAAAFAHTAPGERGRGQDAGPTRRGGAPEAERMSEPEASEPTVPDANDPKDEDYWRALLDEEVDGDPDDEAVEP